MYELDVDEDVNKVLFALCKPLQSAAGTAQAAAASIPGRKKSKGRKDSRGAMPVRICDSGSAVNLFKPCLLGIASNISKQQQSELEGMLRHLVICK